MKLLIIVLVIVALAGAFTVFIKTWMFVKKQNKPTPKLVKIPLIDGEGKLTGNWVECFEGDKYYDMLKERYGEIPKEIKIGSK